MRNAPMSSRLIHLLFVTLLFSYSLIAQPNCSGFQPFSFGVIADCQCESTTCNGQFMLQDAVDYFNNNSDISFCAHLGDFWQDDFAYRSIVQPIYESLNADHHFAIGNHEFDAIDNATKLALPSYLGMPDWYYDFSVYNWRFIIVESFELALNSAGAHPEKAAERDSLLALYPGNNGAGCVNDENVVLFAHHPLVHPNAGAKIRNAQSLIDVLESHDNVVAYMNGHTHSSYHEELNGIHYLSINDMKISTPSTFAEIEVTYDTLFVDGHGLAVDRSLGFAPKIQIFDADMDGVCDGDDQCPGFDDSLLGLPCNDSNPCTSNDIYTLNCGCSGTVIPNCGNADCELIENGIFQNTVQPWQLKNFSTATGNLSITPDGYLKLDVITTGTSNWHLGARQGGVLLQEGKTYQVNYMAYADAARSVDIIITNLAGNQFSYHSKTITTIPKAYSYQFTMNQPTYTDALVNLNAGSQLIDVYFDNITLQEVNCDGCLESLDIQNQNIYQDQYQVEEYIHSNGLVPNPTVVTFKADYILLEADFAVEQGATFDAVIEPCN